jgi:CheY-like chemotaxis protein
MVSDGLEAFEAYKNNRNYDLFLTDENMPNLNGIGAMKKIHNYAKEHNLPIIPVVALTASVLESDRERFLYEGMSDFVGKPIDEDELKTVLAKYCKLKD